MGSDEPEWGEGRSALAGASLDREHTGALALLTVTPERVELCTATLLAPNLVATARHCVAATSADSVRCSRDPARFAEPYPASSLWVNHSGQLSGPLFSFGLLPLSGGSEEFLPVSSVFVPDTESVCGGDLALLILGAELDADEAAPIAPRLDVPVERDEPYTAVGFGATPVSGEQGARRARTGLEVSCTPQDCEATGEIEATEFLGGDGVCSGDSGGPALDAEGRVVGIASRSSDCVDSVYSAVFSWRGFIREVARQAERAGSYPAPEWLTETAPPVPVTPVRGDSEAAADPVAPPAGFPTEEGMQAEPLEALPAGEVSDVARRPPVVDQGGAGSGCSVGGRFRGRPEASLWLLLGAGLVRLAGRRRALSESN